ncbi:MAG: AMP-binding protein [Synergistaceae bacterium]|jgi:acyl-CoA synthetase (AMP-forming)/AMP-acid ligase II|nr:AMP-binding protein [Synergistaceae bacterium]
MTDIFCNSIERFGGRVALIAESGEEVSYAEMIDKADRIASAAEPGSVVLQACRNDTESITAYVGFLRRGVVPILINDSMNKNLIASLVDAYHPSCVYMRADQVADADSVVYRCGNYVLVRSAVVTDYDVNPDLALLLSTSGSTGSPKLVRQSRENITSNTDAIVQYLKISQDDRAITTLPMGYTFGLSVINTHLCIGATLVLTNKTLMDRDFWGALKTHRAATFPGVPYTYEMLKKLRFERMDLPSLKYLSQAGGRLSPELCAEFIGICERKGMEFIIMYGQTEATARMSYLPWEDAKPRPGSIGKAIPGGQFWIEDSGGRMITEPGAVGELMYRGKNVTLGYAESRFDLARGDDNNGVLATGDMAKFDGDGFYYIVGRKKRFLKLYGNRVNLDDVERLLDRAGYESACSGIDDNMRVYTTHRPIDAVRDFIVNDIGLQPAGVSMIEIDRIPRNSSGKVSYSDLERD